MRRLSRSRRHNNDETALPTISLTPLIDTVLVLLVIFMVTTPGKTTPPILTNKKDSPKTDNKDNKQPVSLVEIEQGGQIYLDSKPITYKALLETVKKLTQHSTDQSNAESMVATVFVHAHESAPQQTVTMVLNGLRRLNRVGILVG